MKINRVVSFACAALAAVGLAGGALAAEVECDSTYCFTASDFSGEEQIIGICITQLPDPHTGTAMLGQRVLREGVYLNDKTYEEMRMIGQYTGASDLLPVYMD